MNKLTHDQFLEKLLEKNKHYRNSEFEIVGTTHNNKVIIKTNYGKCLMQRSYIYRCKNPSIASAIDKNKYFENMAREVHGDKYDYSKVEYVNNKTKVEIICKDHGSFWQIPMGHLKGYGCERCAVKYRLSLGSSFKLEDWCKMCKGNPGIFYILKCWNEEEEFYKIGITCNTIRQRYQSKFEMPYSYEIVKEVVDFNRERIWNLEKQYLDELKSNQYIPKLEFKGYLTECFTKYEIRN